MSSHSDSGSDSGSILPPDTPKTLPGYAWRIYREHLEPSLREHFRQNHDLKHLDFVPNGELVLSILRKHLS